MSARACRFKSDRGHQFSLTSISDSKTHRFQLDLLCWYGEAARKLPWRETRDPYRILLSEIMLQQTQVDTVIPYYHRFLKAFPSLHSLAHAPLDRVLKLWEGLGYYSRARNLHALAQAVSKDRGGCLPSNFEELIELPGIGRYTAGAVLSIAFHQDYPVVDGNVQRVLARYFLVEDDITLSETQRHMWKLASSLVPHGKAGDFNQALMELGALICVPRNPHCPVCPLSHSCRARRQKRQNELPVKKRKAPTPHFDIGAGVIWRGRKILIAQRPLKGLLGGLWEFPGGKLERGESLKECAQREIREELGIHVHVGKKVAAIEHAYSHFKITLHVFHCVYVNGTPQTLGVRDWKWVHARELKRFAFPAANQPIIKIILNDARRKKA